MAGRGETAEEGSGVGVEAEVGYGVGAFGGFGVATPYTRFGQAREERRYGWAGGWTGGRETGSRWTWGCGGASARRSGPSTGWASTCACGGRRGGGSRECGRRHRAGPRYARSPDAGLPAAGALDRPGASAPCPTRSISPPVVQSHRRPAHELVHRFTVGPRKSGGSELVRSVASRSSSDDDPGPRATGSLDKQQFPPTPGHGLHDRDFPASPAARASDPGDSRGIFGLGGNCCWTRLPVDSGVSAGGYSAPS